MAEGVTDRETTDAEAVPRLPAPEAPPLPQRTALRFRLVLGVLAGLAAGAIFSASVLVGTGGSRDGGGGPHWSAWRPSGSDVEDAQQIADHVAPNYRLPGGAQLALATGGPLKFQDVPVSVVIRESSGNIHLVGGRSVLFALCGLGDRCAIESGHPSAQRHLLLRRESLELALYSFRYLHDVDQVVTLLPPPPGDPPSQALLLTRADLKPALGRPLRTTLPEPPPSLRRVPTAPDTLFVERATRERLFQFRITQGPDARALLVLSPPSASGQ